MGLISKQGSFQGSSSVRGFRWDLATTAINNVSVLILTMLKTPIKVRWLPHNAQDPKPLNSVYDHTTIHDHSMKRPYS